MKTNRQKFLLLFQKEALPRLASVDGALARRSLRQRRSRLPPPAAPAREEHHPPQRCPGVTQWLKAEWLRQGSEQRIEETRACRVAGPASIKMHAP
jgi:hypothetical protein